MLKCLLAPAALLYKAGVTFRHRLFDWGILKSEKFDIPVICIGNITVGGTGKTPMAEMVIAYMSQMHRVALLSRGYGRRTKGYLEVKADSHYRDVGDEPLQIKLKFPDTVVAVCEKRAEGIRRIRAEHPDVDLVIMDDGFQHRYVEPKVNIVMIDATRPVQHDRMLPLGTLRDLPEELHRAHYFVVTKCPEKMAPIDRRILRKVLIQVAYQRVYFTRFESFMPQPLFPDAAPGEPLLQGQQVIALSGIGSPKPFLAALRGSYGVVAEMTLDDHHVYKVRDLNRLRELLDKFPGAVIVTTEKDAVKLTNRAKIPEEIQRRIYYLPINISFIEDSATDFLQKLEQQGYEVKRGKYTSVKGARQKRFIRFRTLGAGYSEEELKAVISGEAEHHSRQKQKRIVPEQKFQMLVDIQAKLAEGKSMGYARWAKRYNLKEMSKTLIFLQENKIGSIEEMQERIDAATARYHELGDSIKATETRMAEIAVLRTHIVNYARTRPVYDAYRKAGYSKRFLDTHREEITLHKAAKTAFDEAGLKKLPKAKDLSIEYAELLKKKKEAYPDYRKARDEMQELMKAQKNVEMFFAEEKSTTEKGQAR